MKDVDGGDTRKPEETSLTRFTRFVALLGGFAVVGVAALTVVSVIGRYAFGTPITGDYEIVEYGISFAAFCFFAFAHATNSHIIAEFFSGRMSERTTRLIDAIQNSVLFAILILLVWRVIVGGFDKFETGDESMFLAMKSWWLHVVGAFGLGLFAWVAFRKILEKLDP